MERPINRWMENNRRHLPFRWWSHWWWRCRIQPPFLRPSLRPNPPPLQEPCCSCSRRTPQPLECCLRRTVKASPSQPTFSAAAPGANVCPLNLISTNTRTQILARAHTHKHISTLPNIALAHKTLPLTLHTCYVMHEQMYERNYRKLFPIVQLNMAQFETWRWTT